MTVATTSGRWRISVRGWLGGSLATLCAFLAGASAFILYELDLRKHDYQILNLAGQMRVVASSLEQQADDVLGRSVFQIGIEIAESHHEKWDGSGYPHGLKGSAIPLSARIVAVADVFDALTSKRPYKDAFSVEKALDIIHKDAGSHFDPEVVAALDRAMPWVLEIYDRLRHV